MPINQMKKQRLLLMCAPISELPSNISTMGLTVKTLKTTSAAGRSGDEADGGRFARRKLEPEDSSYDSDHESVTFSRNTVIAEIVVVNA